MIYYVYLFVHVHMYVYIDLIFFDSCWLDICVYNGNASFIVAFIPVDCVSVFSAVMDVLGVLTSLWCVS